MHTKKSVIPVLILVVFQAAANIEIKQHTINSGANHTLSSKRFDLQGSLGQNDDGHAMSGGGYQMNTGFWQQNTDLIFKNDLE